MNKKTPVIIAFIAVFICKTSIFSFSPEEIARARRIIGPFNAMCMAAEKGKLLELKKAYADYKEATKNESVIFWKNKEKPIHLAAKGGNLKVLKYIMEDIGHSLAVPSIKLKPKKETIDDDDEKDGDDEEDLANMKGVGDTTPLHNAVEKNHVEAARYLIEKGAKVTPKGKTTAPLMIAAKENNYEMVKLLVENIENKKELYPPTERRFGTYKPFKGGSYYNFGILDYAYENGPDLRVYFYLLKERNKILKKLYNAAKAGGKKLVPAFIAAFFEELFGKDSKEAAKEAAKEAKEDIKKLEKKEKDGDKDTKTKKNAKGKKAAEETKMIEITKI